MPRIVIDARISGTSTGRYVDKLIEHLHKLKPEQEIVILTKSHRLPYMHQIAPSFQAVKSDFKEFTFAEQLGFRRQLKSLKPDLVHFTMTQQPVRYQGKKLTTIHDLTTLRFDNPSKNGLIFGVKRRIYSRVIKRVARDSMAIIAISKYVKADVAKFANIPTTKIAVVYEAADKITAKPQAVARLSRQPFIMYVGRATPHKNLKRLIEAFEILREKYPSLMLVLAGKMDANYKKLEALASHKRLAHAVVFTDFVSEGELRWLYENTRAYVFPSLSEGFGLPSLEAMIHGAPVVSSNATCLPEVNGQAAHYFDPLDINNMAHKVADVLTKPELRQKLVKSGQAQAAKYSWQTTAKQTLEIYKKALAKNT